jgi:O-antigen/teichoic acid export membrane protein
MSGAADRPWILRGATIVLGRGGDALLRFGVFLATARVLAPQEFSLYALLTAALATCEFVFAFGGPRTAIFFRSRGQGRLLFGWLVLLAALGTVLVFGGLAALPALRRALFPDVPARLVLLGLAPLPFVLLCGSLSGTLLGDRKEGLYTAFLWSRTLGGAAVLGLSFLFSSDRLVFLLAGRVAVNAAAAAGLFAAQHSLPAWRGLGQLAPEALRFGLPAALSGGAIALHRRADVLMLSAFGRTAQIGSYAVAYALGEAFWVLTDSLEAALFTDLTHLDGPAAARQASDALRLYRIGAVLAFLLGLAGGEGAIFLFFRDRYPDAALLFPPTLAAAAVWGTSRPCVSYLYARGHGRFVMIGHLVGLLLNVAFCLALIPVWGARGAAAASLCSYSLEVALMTRFFRRKIRDLARASAGAEAAP